MDVRKISALVLAVGLLAGCGPGAPAGDTPGATGTAVTTQGTQEAGEAVIVISDFAFQVPDSVPAGATITIRNEDGVGHTVTSDDDGATFDVAVGPGEEATMTAPEKAGDHPFHCTPHPQMTATLVVRG